MGKKNTIKRDADKYESPNTPNSPRVLIHSHHAGGEL